jgi:hypothetical protein
MSIFDNVESAVRARQPVYPPEKSAGGTNAFTVEGCEVAGCKTGYSYCLSKVSALERSKTLGKVSPKCERAILGHFCPALAMRQEEREAGKALYYIDYELYREELDKAFAVPVPRKASAKYAAPLLRANLAPIKPEQADFTPIEQVKKPASPFIEQDGYAAAINVAIQEAAQSEPVKLQPIPEPKVVSPSPSPVAKSLSMLERARLQMGLNKE